MVRQTTFILLFSAFLTFESCKNNSGKPDDGAKKDSDSLAPARAESVKQEFIPAHPEKITRDTTIKVNGKKYNLQYTIKTIDSSFVMLERPYMGRLNRSLFADYEYFIKLTQPDGNVSSIKLTKQDFKEEFDSIYINNSILRLYSFEGYSEYDGGFFFDFTITRPETDNSYRIKYFVDTKGTRRYEIEDIVS